MGMGRWRVTRLAVGVLGLLASVVAAPVGPAGSSGVATDPGFVATVYAQLGDRLPTSLAFGPNGRLYVTSFSRGEVVTVSDVAGVGSPPVTFATGFRNPLGVVVARNGTVYVSDAEATRDGPFGTRSYGRVWRVSDTNGDGVGDTKEIVLKDLPNGRHNTNGLAFGPEGMLYVTNGNSTDDGVEGGEPEVLPWSGSVVRVDPAATNVSLASLSPATALVATGMRNVYDLAFSPVKRSHLFLPTNGVDDARPDGADPLGGLEDSDDLLYRTEVDDVGGDGLPLIDDFGFPSCLYNEARQGTLEPYDNPNPETIAQFGPCPTATVPRPVATFGLHPSADGLAFQATDAWGPAYKNDLFVAEFGNFFGSPAGHKVVRVELDGKGKKVVSQSDFLVGVTPLDLTFDAAGNMYVADFLAGTIQKVTKAL